MEAAVAAAARSLRGGWRRMRPRRLLAASLRPPPPPPRPLAGTNSLSHDGLEATVCHWCSASSNATMSMNDLLSVPVVRTGRRLSDALLQVVPNFPIGDNSPAVVSKLANALRKRKGARDSTANCNPVRRTRGNWNSSSFSNGSIKEHCFLPGPFLVRRCG